MALCNDPHSPRLPRTRSVLTLDQETAGDAPGGLFFRSGDARAVVELQPKQWRDMGNPDEITVIIWAGDRQDIMKSDGVPK